MSATTKINKVLIANRGEIACRIIKTLRAMDIKSVAVFSDSDDDSMHVSMADEAYHIGPSSANLSYLNIKNIMDAIIISGAQAVHPGYGFLSENYDFARALQRNKIRLIGPSAKLIKKMGDKIEAKKAAQAASVNTVPGYIGVIKSAEEAVEIASNIGYPVILKAAAGGGGRGMRVVNSPEGIPDAFKSASNESKNSFSDDRIFIEKFITKPRHIEIQVLADNHGNVVCLGERECSIQRHHQKVIEEAPSPFIDAATRAKMYEQSANLARQVGYSSAGTVEFIVDSSGNFYFLEMNTRLQVEHCVSEQITGIDIVEQMVRVAQGERLAFTQDDIELKGWSIESRICSEDPSRGFLPSSGRITTYQEPPANPKVRVDSGVSEGGEISIFYDSMIAKLITTGETREEALDLMQKSLGSYVIRGIANNISFLQAVIAHERFQSGDITTNFIDEEYPDGFLGADLNDDTTAVFLCVAIHIYLTEQARNAATEHQSRTHPRKISTRWVVNLDDQPFLLIARPWEDGFKVRFERNRMITKSNWILGSRLFRGTVNGDDVSVSIEPSESGYVLTYAGSSVAVKIRSPRIAELERYIPKNLYEIKPEELQAPISGSVTAVKVNVGDNIVTGQDLVAIEAMKMENVISADVDAKVASINVKEGDAVNVGQVLINFEYPE